MGGGLMQLLTLGTQDQYLTVSPEMSYFKQVYKRPTNFSMQSVQTPFSSAPFINPGSRTLYTCKIPRVGDLLKDVFLSIALPDIYVPTPSDIANGGLQINAGVPNGIPKFRWIPNIGNYIIYSYSIIADTQLLDQRWGEFIDVYNELSQTGDKKPGYDRMTANDSTFLNPSTYQRKVILNNNRISYSEYPYSTDVNKYAPSIKSRRLYIPLDFWFSKSPDLAIPLVALQYQVITINIEFRALEDLYQVYDTIKQMYVSPATYRNTYKTGSYAQLNIGNYLQIGSVKQNTIDINPYLECNYVYLDTPERTYIATNNFDCLVECVYRSETSGINNIYTINLSISNPIKEMIWITRRSDIFNYNDWTNLTAAIPADTSQPALATAKILWNGIDRFDEKDSRYFNLLQPYTYHTASPREGIYCYSFALNPEKIQPSGTFNASTINKVQMYVTMNPFPDTTYGFVDGSANTEYTITVYSVYYNIFRVMSGHGAMVFAN